MRSTWLRTACLPLFLALAGCGGGKLDFDNPTETEVTGTLRTTFTYIYQNYYREPRLADIVLPGLAGLRAVEPELSVAVVRDPSAGDAFELRLRGDLIHRAAEPAWYAGDGWAAVVRDSVKALRDKSPAVAGLSWVEATDLVLASAADALDEDSLYLSLREMKAVGLVVDDETAEDGEAKKPKQQKASAGIRLRYEDGITRIAQVRRNSGAAQAGLRPGDIVDTLQGQPADSYSRLQMIRQFVGTPDSEISLTVRGAGGGASRDVVLRRETVDEDAPVALWRNGVLYLQITDLWGDTVDDVTRLLRAERDKGAAGVSGIVLDLRGTAVANPFAAAQFLDLFYEGTERYFSTIGRPSYIGNYTFRRRGSPQDPAIRLVVLANGETATAAEGMVYALQELGRAVVVGSATSGQGLLQAGSFLLNGGIFALPYASLVTPANFAIEKRGVLPMVCSGAVDDGAAGIAQLKDGQGIINKTARNREIAAGHNAALQAHRALCPPRSDQDDRDLELAEAILADPALYDRVLAAGGK